MTRAEWRAATIGPPCRARTDDEAGVERTAVLLSPLAPVTVSASFVGATAQRE